MLFNNFFLITCIFLLWLFVCKCFSDITINGFTYLETISKNEEPNIYRSISLTNRTNRNLKMVCCAVCGTADECIGVDVCDGQICRLWNGLFDKSFATNTSIEMCRWYIKNSRKATVNWSTQHSSVSSIGTSATNDLSTKFESTIDDVTSTTRPIETDSTTQESTTSSDVETTGPVESGLTTSDVRTEGHVESSLATADVTTIGHVDSTLTTADVTTTGPDESTLTTVDVTTTGSDESTSTTADGTTEPVESNLITVDMTTTGPFESTLTTGDGHGAMTTGSDVSISTIDNSQSDYMTLGTNDLSTTNDAAMTTGAFGLSSTIDESSSIDDLTTITDDVLSPTSPFVTSSTMNETPALPGLRY
ncbi:uncharacterized protein LOC144621233 [Crassostrea virginica]